MFKLNAILSVTVLHWVLQWLWGLLVFLFGLCSTQSVSPLGIKKKSLLSLRSNSTQQPVTKCFLWATLSSSAVDFSFSRPRRWLLLRRVWPRWTRLAWRPCRLSSAPKSKPNRNKCCYWFSNKVKENAFSLSSIFFWSKEWQDEKVKRKQFARNYFSMFAVQWTIPLIFSSATFIMWTLSPLWCHKGKFWNTECPAPALLLFPSKCLEGPEGQSNESRNLLVCNCKHRAKHTSCN